MSIAVLCGRGVPVTSSAGAPSLAPRSIGGEPCYECGMRHTVVLAFAFLVACKKEPSRLDPPSTWGSGSAGASAPIAPQATPPSASGNELSGTVAETMNAGGYTYARIERDGTSTWIAGPETKLAVGMKLGKMDGMAMQGFHSDTLTRTFDQIYFVNSIPIEGGAPATAAASPPGGDDIEGVVTETMNAGGYTYAQLDHAGTKLWVAGPETKLAVGSQLGKMTGSLMTNFRSDTLKRSFDQIYFITSFNVAAAAIPNPHTKPTPDPNAPAAPMEKIAPAVGGTTVADVIAKQDQLVGKPVVVRGKVVKVNNGILGRNWIHLRDGTGGAATNDLLVTTDAVAKLGDIVVARGTVATHQDFGAGYKYDVIVEKATLADK